MARALPSASSNVTLAGITSARVELEHREMAAAADGGIHNDQDNVVIAREVTPAQLERVVEGTQAQRGQAHIELASQVGNYAAANGLKAGIKVDAALGPHGVAMPDIQLATRTSADGSQRRVVIALFEIEVEHRTGPQMIVTAAEYLTHLETVECVVFIKFYHARQPYWSRFDELRMPAVVLVFRRGSGRVNVDGQDLWRVRVTQSRSFGNVEVDPAALTAFMAWVPAPHTQALLENPFDNQWNRPIHLFRPSPLFPDPFDTRNLDRELLQAVANAREREAAGADGAVLSVPIRDDLPELRLDLIRLFDTATDGWSADRHFRGFTGTAAAAVDGGNLAVDGDVDAANGGDADGAASAAPSA